MFTWCASRAGSGKTLPAFVIEIKGFTDGKGIHDTTVAEIHRNLPPSMFYEHAIRYEKDASIRR